MLPANPQHAKWEERFRRPGYWAGDQPAPFLREVLPLVGAPGCALELAMGEGRNAVYLAQQGWRVTGVELAAAGLEKAEALARARGVHTWRACAHETVAPAPGVLLREADLLHRELPQGPWKLILVVNFLLRPLLPVMARALPRGAFLAYETYTVRQLAFDGGPRSREYLFDPGELRHAFSDLDILIYREWSAGKGVASLLAQRS
jgi:hypothetical protein